MNHAPECQSLRILHVLKGMDRGGIETWLMHVLRKTDRERFRFDFMTGTLQPCAYDDELRSMGCGIHPCLDASRPWIYARNFFRIIRRQGPYDVIHSHVHHYSGFVCWLARRAGIPVRMVHSHSDTRSQEATAGLARHAYLRIMERLVSRYATAGLACSREAALALFGRNWEGDGRWQVLPCGIDVEAFRRDFGRDSVRAELGLPSDAVVVGHVGRFMEVKNHPFMLEVLSRTMASQPRLHALLVGDGPLRSRMEERAAQLGIRNRIVFAGARSDVPRLMTGAMDVFLFPSVLEGLGLAVVEAQAAGLPCLISDAIPPGADVVPALIRRLPLGTSPAIWSRVLLEMSGKAHDRAGALELISASPFSISRSVQALERRYIQLARPGTQGGRNP